MEKSSASIVSTTRTREDEDHLPLSEQSNRPSDIPIQTQTIAAWHPILDPNWVIFTYLALAVIMIPFGYYLVGESDKIVELKQLYDDGNTEVEGVVSACASIGENYNANENCTLTFEVPQDMEPPVLVYYELTNFHQNYNKYVTSRDDYQLTGRVSGQSAIEAANCNPLNILGEITINPCGLIANTFFNDIFTLESTVDVNGNELSMKEDGIAWGSDLKYKFKMPNGFKAELCPEGGCDASCCRDNNFSCEEPAINQTGCYAYHYPLQNSTQYLYQTYPKIISPLEHVTNEHFVVWMRVAATRNFRKLYGYFEETIPAGTKLQFNVNMNYVVESFKGTKTLTITTNSMWGTKDPTLGTTIYIIGYFCLACGFFFGLKHFFKPRKIADPKYLHYKEE